MSVWTIILAAGAGSRFGGPKALADWGGRTLLRRAIECAPVHENIVVVTGAHHDAIEQASGGFATVHNAHWEQGMGSSVSTGISYVAARCGEVALVLPVDQPLVTETHLNKLALRAKAEDRCVLTQDGNIAGPPAAIPAACFGGLMTLTDKGLKSVLLDYSVIQGYGALRDIDTQADLARLKREAGMV